MVLKESLKPTIFIIEDDAVVCQSLRWLFESVNLHVEIYPNASAFMKAYARHRYGCIIIDIRLPGMSGLQLQEHLVQLKNPIPIIIITGHGDISLAVRAMKLGAKDFILKPFNNDLLLEQIQKVLAEGSQEQRNIYHQFSTQIEQLTPRERQVMELVIAGNLNKEIASILQITVSTVEQHRANIMKKMQVKSLAELVKIHTLIHRTSLC